MAKDDKNEAIQVTVNVAEGAPLKFRQVWLESKSDELECSVYTTIDDTKFVIKINDKFYYADMSEFVGSLIEKVVS